uniref:Uncharacterized protein n=1 Tax=Megaselia scalaris TaxID=36166 RepID=T1GQW1_MEGSC
MVSPDDGEKLCHDLGCSAFKEISVRENIDEVDSVFYDIYRYSKLNNKQSILKRSISDIHFSTDLFGHHDEVRKSMDTMSLRTSLKTNTKSSKSRGRALTDDILPFHPQEFFTTAPHITIPRSNNSSRKAKSSERRLSFQPWEFTFSSYEIYFI